MRIGLRQPEEEKAMIGKFLLAFVPAVLIVAVEIGHELAGLRMPRGLRNYLVLLMTAWGLLIFDLFVRNIGTTDVLASFGVVAACFF